MGCIGSWVVAIQNPCIRRVQLTYQTEIQKQIIAQISWSRLKSTQMQNNLIKRKGIVNLLLMQPLNSTPQLEEVEVLKVFELERFVMDRSLWTAARLAINECQQRFANSQDTVGLFSP